MSFNTDGKDAIKTSLLCIHGNDAVTLSGIYMNATYPAVAIASAVLYEVDGAGTPVASWTFEDVIPDCDGGVGLQFTDGVETIGLQGSVYNGDIIGVNLSAKGDLIACARQASCNECRIQGNDPQTATCVCVNPAGKGSCNRIEEGDLGDLEAGSSDSLLEYSP